MKKKPMHGQFHRDHERISVDKEKFLVCLCSSGLKGETEGIRVITAAQDKAFSTRYHSKYIT